MHLQSAGLSQEVIREKSAVSRLGIIGVGNVLAGDDGAGNIVVSRLIKTFPHHPDVYFHNLETDLLELWDVIGLAESFIFVDAIAGVPAGRLVEAGRKHAKRAFSPSLHQMDITTVMSHLCSLRSCDPPKWTVWGITIEPPEFLEEGLSPETAEAVDHVTSVLTERIRAGDYSIKAPGYFDHL